MLQVLIHDTSFLRWPNACVIKVKGILLNLMSDETVLLSSAQLLWRDFYSNLHLFCHSFMFWLSLCSLSGLTACYSHLNDGSRGWNASQVCWWLGLKGIGGKSTKMFSIWNQKGPDIQLRAKDLGLVEMVNLFKPLWKHEPTHDIRSDSHRSVQKERVEKQAFLEPPLPAEL